MPKESLTAPRRKARAKLASSAAAVSRCPDDPAIGEAAASARRDYYALALEDYIQRTVDAAGPLTPEERDRIALLLRGGGGDG